MSSTKNPSLRLSDRAREHVALIYQLADNEANAAKPNKVLIHEARLAFPKLTARDVEVAFCVVRDKRPGRPSRKKK